MPRLPRYALALCTLLGSAAQPLLAQAPGPVAVYVSAVDRAPFADRIEALGTLKANESTLLTATVTERVAAIHFDDGQRVERGEVLVELADAEERAELAAERSTLAEALRQVERLEPLVAQGAASKSLLDQRQREAATAEARVTALESRLTEYRIRAPFSGVVGLRDLSVGALVQPGTRITTLNDLSSMKLDFTVPSRFLPVLRRGLTIEARTAAWPGEVFRGEISGLDNAIDPVSRSLTVRARLPNPQHRLRPGLLMQVVLHARPRESLRVPEEALILEQERAFVYRLVPGDPARVTRREVRLGLRRPGEAEVIDGLNEGDRVVSHGTVKLTDGRAVRVLGEQAPGEGLEALLRRRALANAATGDSRQ